MQPETTEKAIDPNVNMFEVAMPLRGWWLVDAAMGTAERLLQEQANDCLEEGWSKEAETWHRIARDTALARAVISLVIMTYGSPRDFME